MKPRSDSTLWICLLDTEDRKKQHLSEISFTTLFFSVNVQFLIHQGGTFRNSFP